MVDALVSLATTLALEAEEDMTIPVCNRWVVLPNDEDSKDYFNVIYVLKTYA